MGGCGEGRFRIRENFDGAVAGSLGEDSEIRVYIPNAAGTVELWYSGYVDKVTPNISSSEYIDLFCLGYANQLKRIIVKEKTYSGMELSMIVRNIAEVYATGYTGVTSTAPDYEDTGFTADSLYFDENAYEAISKIADIAGKREWGVRADKSLFFKRRDDSIKFYFNLKQDFISFTPTKDYNPIITKIYLEGSEGYSQEFMITNKITQRESIVSNSAILTESVGYQFARAYLKEHGVPKRSYSGRQVGRTTRIESTLPIGRANVYMRRGVSDRYDTAKLYDNNVKYDGGNEQILIERIQYSLSDQGVNAQINFGPIPPTLSDELSRLDSLLQNERITI
jgi:hypothetical protein